MKLEQSFRLSSTILAVIGFFGLCLTGELPLPLVLLGLAGFGAAVAQGFGWPIGEMPSKISRETWNALNILALIAFFADVLWISEDLLPAGVHFLVFVMVNKLCNLRGRADFLQLYVISLMAVLAAASLTVELWYAAVFVGYLLAAVWTMLLFHLQNETEEARAAGVGIQSSVGVGFISGRFFWLTNGVALAAFVLTLAIFFIIPRIGAGFFQKSRGEVTRTSGFSDQVDLGVIGAVKQDPSLVMRVEFPGVKGAPNERLYFRGAAFDRYDGRSWTNTRLHRRSLLRTQENTFQVTDEANLAHTGLRQDILLESLDVPVLFGVTGMETIKGNFPVVQTDAMGNFYLPYAPSGRFQYTAYSVSPRMRREERTARDIRYSDTVLARFLQLPAMSPRVAALARETAKRAATPFETVMAVEQYLRQTYAYSLDVGTEEPLHPIEDFLFVRKTGYCEHYATAMVVMLRTLGIPARLVTGFLPGDWNEFGNYFTVRQQDAHAWVEVYFPSSGWITFDPTPSVAAQVPDPIWKRLGSALDSVKLKWDQIVIRYSFKDQMAVAQGIRHQSDRVRTEASMWLASARHWAARTLDRMKQSVMQANGATAILFVGGLIVLAMAGWWLGRRFGWSWVGLARLGSKSARPSESEIARLYVRMVKILEAHGLSKPPSAAPREFARRVASQWAEAGPLVMAFTDLYCRVRFGLAPLTPEETQSAQAVLQGLRALRRLS